MSSNGTARTVSQIRRWVEDHIDSTAAQPVMDVLHCSRCVACQRGVGGGELVRIVETPSGNIGIAHHSTACLHRLDSVARVLDNQALKRMLHEKRRTDRQEVAFA